MVVVVVADPRPPAVVALPVVTVHPRVLHVGDVFRVRLDEVCLHWL